MKILSLVTIVLALVSALDAYKDPLVGAGRSVMIHLFEWKWTE